MNEDINFHAIVKWSVGIVAAVIASIAFCALCVAGFYWVNKHYLDKPRATLAPVQRLPPEPRLQASPPLALEKLREREEALLHSYGWVDKPEGVVRIPIERAIALVAEESR